MDCSTPGCPVLHHLLEFAHICELSLWQIVFLGCVCLETPHLFSARLSMEVTHGVMRHPDGDADPRGPERGLLDEGAKRFVSSSGSCLH